MYPPPQSIALIFQQKFYKRVVCLEFYIFCSHQKLLGETGNLKQNIKYTKTNNMHSGTGVVLPTLLPPPWKVIFLI